MCYFGSRSIQQKWLDAETKRSQPLTQQRREVIYTPPYYSSGTDSPRRSYAEVVSQKSSSDSDSLPLHKRESHGKRKEEAKTEKKEDFDWNKVVVITRRYIHDDSFKIIDKLKNQLESDITYKQFHAEKAIILFKDTSQAQIILLPDRGHLQRIH
ncbi:hypothetical protein Csa_004423 [Cucumis sativus]|uniref:DUF4283 domain-containing protein n=1 Tax=Cucumis sativus TaxID=3659 RepID=A0A0A0KF42_CUCSA|nr:hypothetical protein Csa_004423 [Cucumis sativus]